MIKAVVFDLDDTLISEKDYIKSGFRAVSKYISLNYNKNYHDIVTLLDSEFLYSNKNVFNRVLDKLNIKYNRNDILELVGIYRNHVPEIDFLDDSKECLEYLRLHNYKLGIITDGYKETQLNKIGVLKCKEKFDCIVVTDELGREFWKPHEKAYTMVVEKLNIKYNECIYVGDNIDKDFISANKLGVHTVGINRGNGIYSDTKLLESKYLPQYNITNLIELESIIKLINKEE